MGIEDILMYDETIFQNINAFDPDYMPPDYNHRDTQMEAMAMAIRPAMKGGQPSNSIVLDSPATKKKQLFIKFLNWLKRKQKRLFVFILIVNYILLVSEYFLKYLKKFLAICLLKLAFHFQEFMIKS